MVMQVSSNHIIPNRFPALHGYCQEIESLQARNQEAWAEQGAAPGGTLIRVSCETSANALPANRTLHSISLSNVSDMSSLPG